ncbi:MAG: hypothetical protein K0S47_1620 [Herbinix sp.]|jgi:vancomycin resistance protein YoaR|nr:hypothetical protein [Herbinix sp.]
MNKKIIILSAVLLLSLSFVIGNAFIASAVEDGNTITDGVFIDEVNISGMTRQEAEDAVSSFVDTLRGKSVTIDVDNNLVETSLTELGFNYSLNDTVDQALNLGKTGNLIKRYKDLKDIKETNMVYPISFTLDDNKIKELVKNECSKFNVDPVNATVSRKDGSFIYTDHQAGRTVQIDDTVALIKDAVLEDWNRSDIVVTAAVEDEMPEYTRDIVEQCNKLLGTFTTEYASSAEGRAANLANGARLINNTVLYPGDIFSAYEYLTPFTVENGYYQAGAYLNGKVIDSIGGGACQVTTTLYNAVLFSELEVVERAAHSMTISYVDLSRDAAIAGTYKDFKFKNNLDIPILIEASTKNRQITFKIWGHETRDASRTVKYETVVLNEKQPPKDVVTEDPSQPTTYKKVTQSAHVGYTAELYKVVYENNVEVSRERINKSVYEAAPRYITVGTKVVEEKPPKNEDDDKKAEETLDQDNNGIENPSVEDEPLDMNLEQDSYWDEFWNDDEFEDN